MAEAFWCILLSTLLIVWYIKHLMRKLRRGRKIRPVERDWSADIPLPPVETKSIPTEAEKAAEKQRKQDIADLKRQGYTDEIIAVILPTINNGQ